MSRPEHTEETIRAALAADARRFLQGGGHVTWAEWQAISRPQRDALVEAGRLLERDRLEALLAVLSVGPPALAVLSQEAGDVAPAADHDDALVEAAVRRLANA